MLKLTSKPKQRLPDFSTIASKEKEFLIVKYCKSLKTNEKPIYFPYINVTSGNIFIYKIAFFNETTYEIKPLKSTTLPQWTGRCGKLKFSFVKGNIQCIKSLQNMNQFQIEHTSPDELKIKRFQNEKFIKTSIQLNKNWSNNDSLKNVICNDSENKNNKTFPIPVNGLLTMSNLMQKDLVFSRKKQFAGYGKFGSKFKSGEYGQCQNNIFHLKKCPKNNAVYAGGGECVELHDPLSTCLEFPRATLKHPLENNKFFKCQTKFPFYKEKTCPAFHIFNNVKCVPVNLCKTNFNTKIAIPENFKSQFPTESYIECVNGEAITRICSEKYISGKLTEFGNGCCDLECSENMNQISLINIKISNPESFIKEYPGDVKHCKHGELIHHHQKPILRKVREAVFKGETHEILLENKLKLTVKNAKIEYDLPTFIYTIREGRVEKKFLETFRDAPELFFIRKLPVNYIGKKRNEQYVYVYIDDNLYTNLDTDLKYREERGETL